MDRGAWRATVHWVTNSQKQLSDFTHKPYKVYFPTTMVWNYESRMGTKLQNSKIRREHYTTEQPMGQRRNQKRKNKTNKNGNVTY